MNYLLDTHVALWWWSNNKNLSTRIKELMMNTDNQIWFSPISGYEILLKNRLGKLPLPDSLIKNLPKEVRAAGWIELPVRLADTSRAAMFESSHRDPFDRILSAQSLNNDYPIISSDQQIDSFTPERIW